ncbi:MAG: hypothetical protein FJ387_07425 [Verrucomicrobia bacterium]|nr:hypothetical protein [Verrucomicrobiota bacterium]
MKAELIRTGWFLAMTHDLRVLGGELQARNSDLLDRVRPLCEAFAEVYFTDRYPGFDLEEPDWHKLRDHLEQVAVLAETVRARACGIH